MKLVGQASCVLNMSLGYKLEATLVFQSGYKLFPNNGKWTPNNVTSIAVMEVTSESSELLIGRRSYYTNNYLRQALYKGYST